MQDKERQQELAEKLAKVKGLKDIPGIICDKYCKYPYISGSWDELNRFCAQCELQELLQALILV